MGQPAQDVTIRPMSLADISAVRAIDNRSFALPWSEHSYLFELNENAASRLWVAETTPESVTPRQITGMLVIWMILDEAHIGTLAVDPGFRQMGIARKLLATGLLAACREGAHSSLLEVRRGNTGAQVLYQRFGYKIVGVRPRYYRDNGEDALLMTLDPLDEEKLRAFLDPA